MKFERICIKDPNPAFAAPEFESVEWYSGIYKISRYHRKLTRSGRHEYSAFYKPRGWKNWGNHVNRATPEYRTLKAAKAACEVHASQEGQK